LTPAHHLDHVRCNVPGIGKDSEAMTTIRNNVLHRLTRIMRHGKWVQLKIANHDRVVAFDAGVTVRPMSGPNRSGSPVRHAYVPPKSTDTGSHTTHVIRMVMGDGDSMNTFGLDIQSLQATGDFARAKTAVDQYAGISCFDQPCISPAATAEGGKTH
jgi:hypothetical protein